MWGSYKLDSDTKLILGGELLQGEIPMLPKIMTGELEDNGEHIPQTKCLLEASYKHKYLLKLHTSLNINACGRN